MRRPILQDTTRSPRKLAQDHGLQDIAILVPPVHCEFLDYCPEKPERCENHAPKNSQMGELIVASVESYA